MKKLICLFTLIFAIVCVFSLTACGQSKKYTVEECFTVIRKIDAKNNKNKMEEKEKLNISTSRDLLQESTNIGDLKKYNMMLQNIELSQNVKNYLNNNR